MMSGLEKKIEQMKTHATENGYAPTVRELMEKNGLPLFEALAAARAAWDVLHEKKAEKQSVQLQKSNFQSDIYNALSDVMYQYSKSGVKISKGDCQAALDWFCKKFFEDEMGGVFD